MIISKKSGKKSKPENLDWEEQLEKFNFDFPKKLIAKKPAEPRDSACLLIYERKTGKICFDIFRNIWKYLPEKSVLVFNETKVIPARIELRKETGGKAVLLFLEKEKNLYKFLCDKKIPPESRLFLGKEPIFYCVKKENGIFFLKLLPGKNFQNLLKKYGRTPVPPYIKNTPLSEKKLREKYQTVFAKKEGSVAAPTASLHFTGGLLNKLRKKGFGIEFINLRVGLGTFSPLAEENFQKNELHEEFFSISKKTARRLLRAKKEKRPVIAVGTTSARCLESAFCGGKFSDFGRTKLFIRERRQIKFIDGLITNFHVPRSSLLMLVSAFAGREETISIYKKAVKKNFKLFSFGDGMVVI